MGPGRARRPLHCADTARVLFTSVRLFVLALSGLSLLAGCGGSSAPPVNTTTTPPNPGTVAVTAPASGATVATLPVAVTLSLSNGASLSNLKITLDGTDITSSFASAAGNTATAQISQPVDVGGNRIQIVNGSESVNSQFTYDPSSGGTNPAPPGSSTPSTTLKDAIPIQTLVQMTNELGQQVWGIQVGQNAYPAPGVQSNTSGFQVTWLQRSGLSMVFNATYNVVDDPSALAFASGIAPSAAKIGN